MSRFIEGEERSQSVLFPESLDEWITEDNPVRVVDAFVEELDLAELGFGRAEPAETGRPAYHPGTLLKIYIYGYQRVLEGSEADDVWGSRSPGLSQMCVAGRGSVLRIDAALSVCGPDS